MIKVSEKGLTLLILTVCSPKSLSDFMINFQKGKCFIIEKNQENMIMTILIQSLDFIQLNPCLMLAACGFGFVA